MLWAGHCKGLCQWAVRTGSTGCAVRGVNGGSPTPLSCFNTLSLACCHAESCLLLVMTLSSFPADSGLQHPSAWGTGDYNQEQLAHSTASSWPGPPFAERHQAVVCLPCKQHVLIHSEYDCLQYLLVDLHDDQLLHKRAIHWHSALNWQQHPQHQDIVAVNVGLFNIAWLLRQHQKLHHHLGLQPSSFSLFTSTAHAKISSFSWIHQHADCTYSVKGVDGIQSLDCLAVIGTQIDDAHAHSSCGSKELLNVRYFSECTWTVSISIMAVMPQYSKKVLLLNVMGDSCSFTGEGGGGGRGGRSNGGPTSYILWTAIYAHIDSFS